MNTLYTKDTHEYTKGSLRNTKHSTREYTMQGNNRRIDTVQTSYGSHDIVALKIKFCHFHIGWIRKGVECLTSISGLKTSQIRCVEVLICTKNWIRYRNLVCYNQSFSSILMILWYSYFGDKYHKHRNCLLPNNDI